MPADYRGWGMRAAGTACAVVRPGFLDEIGTAMRRGPVLAFGNGRSYGDEAQLTGGTIIDMRSLRRVQAFDRELGVARFEGGMLLSEILAVIVPQGWFLPTTPGTQFVTIGGAVANDVHGKNHHHTGSLGCHVVKLGLYRSDGQFLECSPGCHADLFYATIGGLGLTGVIGWVEIRLRKTGSPAMLSETRRYGCFEEFFEIAAESERFDTSVAWVDFSASGKRLGRGIFERATFTDAAVADRSSMPNPVVPFTPPFSLVNRLTVPLFNAAHYHKAPKQWRRRLTHYRSVFYPLDAIGNWNRIYGRRGFFQFQCVIPPEAAMAGLRKLFTVIQASGRGSFLVVLKTLGTRSSGGMLSFPRPGTTLAIDFAYDDRAVELHRVLEAVTLDHDGVLYPAKDSMMTPRAFRRLASRWEEFAALRDPGISSDFIRRVAA